MSLTSYRAAPPRGRCPACSAGRGSFVTARASGGAPGRDRVPRPLRVAMWLAGTRRREERERWGMWSGGDLLSRVLGRSTIGAAGLNGRVRDGTGCFPRAVATRPSKPPRQGASKVGRRMRNGAPGLSRGRGPDRAIRLGCLDCTVRRALAAGSGGPGHSSSCFPTSDTGPPSPDRIKPIGGLVPVD